MDQELFAVVKGILGLVRDQLSMIQALRKNHDDLVASLGRACGLSVDEVPMEPAIDQAAFDKMQQGVRELEGMFAKNDATKEGES
jgi:hypothetical protein